MMNTYKETLTESPIDQIWKELRLFLDVDLSTDHIRSIQKIDDETFYKQLKNIRKQAIQIGFCIKQAEEYFYSSKNVSLATRPLLLYYGATSLSKALTLLKLDGDYSIDRLRDGDKHNHHGLELLKDFSSITNFNLKPDEFFKILKCKINYHTRKKIPWGHYPLVYQSLSPDTVAYPIKFDFEGSSISGDGKGLQNCADIPDVSKYKDHIYNSFSLMSNLPDLYSMMTHLNFKMNLFPGDIYMHRLKHIGVKAGDKILSEKYTDTYHFLVRGIGDEEKNDFINIYSKSNPEIQFIDVGPYNLHGVAAKTYEFSTPPQIYLPDVVDDIFSKIYFIYKVERFLPEICSHLILLFIFGMISRYHPDIWMKIISKNIKVIEILDSLLNVIYRKFPNLVLNQMSLSKNSIHM